MITLSGFEGGTGAARSHALRHVGLPSDIGARGAPGADGGGHAQPRRDLGGRRLPPRRHREIALPRRQPRRLRHLAMVSLGCTICRGCQLDTCHVGIATQIESKDEAELKGLKKFTPQGRARLRTAPASSAPWARRCGRSPPRSASSAPRTWWAARPARPGAPSEGVDVDELIKPIDEMLDLEPRPAAARRRPRAAGLIVARPIRMKAKAASAKLAALAGNIAHGKVIEEEWDVGDGGPSTPTTACSARSSAARSRACGSPRAARGQRRHARPAPLQRRLGRRPGPRRLQRLRRGHHRRGRRPGRRGQGRTGRQGRDHEGQNRFGKRVNGSVGKSFAYGAQRGRLFVQGDADSRFCIRLSGADVVIGGEPGQPLDDSLGCVADRANIKGFAFEYMTNGRAVVLGDPGPWFCAGQTGGRVYLRVNHDWNPTRDALAAQGQGRQDQPRGPRRRGHARRPGAARPLRRRAPGNRPGGRGQRIMKLAAEPQASFIMSVPMKEQTDPSISTE